MKLMKHITIALVLCAIPAMAFGQTADCENCDHQLPVYMGAAGFVAMAGEDAEMVNWRSTCGNVTRTGMLMPNDDGVVASLLDGDLACADEKGMFELGPIMDGGWFWMHKGDNSAVGNIVAKDILMNDKTEITDSGNVDMMMGSGAVVLTHPSSGRFGILPNILPEPPAPDATMCGAYRKADRSVAQTTTNCMLGDGSTMVRIKGPGDFGRSKEYVGSATVYRNANANLTLTMDLWTAGGIVTVDATSTTAPVGTGYSGLGTGLSFTTVRPTVSAFGASVAGALGSGNETITVTQGDASADPPTSDTATVVIESSTASEYCTTSDKHDAVVSFAFVSDQANTLPGPKNLAGAGQLAYHGGAMLTIKCTPPAGNNVGTELVPENPFPTTE